MKSFNKLDNSNEITLTENDTSESIKDRYRQRRPITSNYKTSGGL